MDRGVMAFLSNSLQQLKKEDSKQKLHQRKVTTYKLFASHLTLALEFVMWLSLSVTDVRFVLISGSEVASSVGSSQSGYRYQQGGHNGAEAGKKTMN